MPMIQASPPHKLSLPAVPLPDWEAEAEERILLQRINRTQVRYKGMSKVNPTGAAAPAVLAPLMLRSLESLRDRVGDIDEWVSGNLRWTLDEMAGKLASEQVDAVALAMDSMDRGGFLVADVTGFGKGRIAACIARYAVLMGRRMVFFTEKANLFSDFWRDVRDIGSEDVFGKPFLLNWGSGAKAVKIVDTSSSEGKVLFPPLRKVEVDEALRDGLPDDVRLVMTTYSQFNRPGRKTEWLESIAPGSHFLMDEGHNQAGDSSTSKNIAPALEASSSSTYSTATAGRDVVNLATYRSVFPWLASIGDPENLSAGQRRALAEVSVREACARGRIVRREHDLSNMHLQLMVDSPNLEHSTELADALAPILSRMARLSNKVYATLERRNEAAKDSQSQLPPGQRKAASEFWFAANFGSRLNNLIGQFLVALKVDAAVEACVQDMLEGVKPVVVVESTMESLMRELSKEPDEATALADEDSLEEQPAQDEEPGEESAAGSRAPTYGEALRVMAERLLRVSVRRGGPEGEKEVIELDDPDMLQARDEIVAMAAMFPALSLSPIDDIRERVEAEGRRLHALGKIAKPWVMDEVSARSMRVVGGKYVPMGNQDRNVSVARFNNGDTDGIILTNAASTGLSLHDAPHFKQHARRRMYELRAPRNVVQRIQMWGRVFRRGQLTEPEFRILSTGMDAEMFDLAVQNRKVQGLSASVTGDGGAGVVVAARDYEDTLGNAIAYDILMEKPNLADSMAISLKVDKEEGDKSLYWISKLLRRLWLVPEGDRKFLYSSLQDAYEERMRAGAPTADGAELPGEWRVVGRRLLEKGDNSDDPLTGGDVYVTDIEQDRIADPIGTKELAWLIEHADADYMTRMGRLPHRLREDGPAAMNALLGRRWRSVEKALKEEGENPIKRMARTVRSMGFLIGKVRPGVSAVLPGEDGEPVRCVIIDARFPGEGADIFSPRQWALSYAVPGEDELRVVTMDVLLANERMKVGTRAEGMEMMDEFAAAPRGASTTKRRLIDGSALGAVMSSVRLGAGTRISYKDGWGGTHEGMLLPVTAARRILSVPGIANSAEAAQAVISAGGRLVSSTDPGSCLEIRPWSEGRQGDRAMVSVPAARKYAKIWEDNALLEAVGGWHDYNQRKQAVVSLADLPALMAAVKGLGLLMQHDAEYRLAVQEATSRHQQPAGSLPNPIMPG